MKSRFVFTVELDDTSVSTATLEVFDKTGPALMSVSRQVRNDAILGNVLEGMLNGMRASAAFPQDD